MKCCTLRVKYSAIGTSVTAWIDSNGDGLFNRNESPLREVQIHVDDLHNQRVDAG